MLRKLLYTVLLLIIAHFSYADENDLDKIVFNAAVVRMRIDCADYMLCSLQV